MKENLFKFLFGDKPKPEQMPKCLFKEEWKCEANSVQHRMATLIVSLVPKNCMRDDTSEVIKRVRNNLGWEYSEIVDAVMAEHELKPLKSKDEFVRFLCENILEKGGDR